MPLLLQLISIHAKESTFLLLLNCRICKWMDEWGFVYIYFDSNGDNKIVSCIINIRPVRHRNHFNWLSLFSEVHMISDSKRTYNGERKKPSKMKVLWLKWQLLVILPSSVRYSVYCNLQIDRCACMYGERSCTLESHIEHVLQESHLQAMPWQMIVFNYHKILWNGHVLQLAA